MKLENIPRSKWPSINLDGLSALGACRSGVDFIQGLSGSIDRRTQTVKVHPRYALQAWRLMRLEQSGETSRDWNYEDKDLLNYFDWAIENVEDFPNPEDWSNGHAYALAFLGNDYATRVKCSHCSGFVELEESIYSQNFGNHGGTLCYECHSEIYDSCPNCGSEWWNDCEFSESRMGSLVSGLAEALDDVLSARDFYPMESDRIGHHCYNSEDLANALLEWRHGALFDFIPKGKDAPSYDSAYDTCGICANFSNERFLERLERFVFGNPEVLALVLENYEIPESSEFKLVRYDSHQVFVPGTEPTRAFYIEGIEVEIHSFAETQSEGMAKC